MSLLGDARRLAADCPNATDRGGRGECYYCAGGNYAGGYLSGSPTEDDFRHEPDCPWLSMPKIAAALEAAEQMIRDADALHCADSCLDESLNTLEAALKGEDAP